MTVELALQYGVMLLVLMIIGGIVWWRSGVAEERERQKQAGTAAE